MLKKLTISTFAFLLFVSVLQAQENWSLEQCIRYAQQNSLTVKQAQATIQTNQLALKQSKFNRYPSLSGSASYGYNFGLSVNPLTNTYSNQSVGYNSLSLSGNVTLFAGNQINNDIKQNRFLLEAAQLDANSTANTLGLDVATAYLNILLGGEQLANARQQLALSQAQLEQIDRLIKAGSRPEGDRYDILAQIARNEQTIIDAQNTIDIGYLNLKQLMNVDPNVDLQIQRPEVNVPSENPENFNLTEVYNTALNTQPQVKAADLRLQGAQVGVDLAKGALYPSLVLFGNLDTRYSTEGQAPTGKINTIRQEQVVFLDDTPVTIGQDVQIPIYEKSTYFDQLNNNFGQSFGLSLNVPIFNRLQNRIGVQRAQVQVLNSEVTNAQVRQQLKTNIQNAIANARAAKQSYQAAQRSVEASQIAFENSQRRFDLGAINTFDYTTARNNLDQAQISLIQAKYRYIFNVKVVDFYMGKAITID